MPSLQTSTELRERGSTRSNRKHFKGAIITHKHRLQTHTQMLAALRRFTAHLQPQSTAPQQMELAGSRYLAEGGKPEYPEKNPRSQIEIDKS